MLLVFTGSADGTCDLLFSKLGRDAFRLNFDIYRDYLVAFSNDGWSITNPTGFEITSRTATAAHWWKAFNYTTDHGEYVTEEVKYLFRELYNWFEARGLVRGNSPYFHKRMGKLTLLSVARRYFHTPKTVAGWQFRDGIFDGLERPVIAKSLSSGLIATNKVLYTTEVLPERLDRSYPWFLQERVDAESDVTIQLCGQRIFAFSRSRVGLEGLDWRREIFTPQHERAKWLPRTLSDEDAEAVRAFSKAIDVNWGRLDFLQSGDRLVFLEFNANGQWAFLDEDGQAGLLPAIVEFLRS